MKKITLCCLVLFIPVLSIFSQANFKEGYIITNTNDTVYGLIDFRTDYSNAEQCKFKINEASSPTIYRPGEIEGYRFKTEGKYYISKTIKIDSVRSEVFLEFLVKGMMNLYYFPKGSGYFFFENMDGTMVAITKTADKIIDNSHVSVDNRFKGVMTYVFRDCTPIATQTSQARFGKGPMIKYTKKYHNLMCESGESCIVFENDYKKKFTKFGYNVFTGAEYNKLILTAIQPTEVVSISPVIGVGADISSPRLTKSIYLFAQASLSRIEGSYDFIEFKVNKFNYEFSSLKSNIDFGVRYCYPKGNVRPTLSVAYDFCNFPTLKSKYIYNDVTTINYKLPKKSNRSFSIGIGADFHLVANQFIIARILYSKFINTNELMPSYQFNVGYSF